MSTQPIKLLFVGDIHHQKHDRDALICSRALDFWRSLTQGSSNPDALFLVGDLIDGYKLPIDVCRNDFLAATAALRECRTQTHAIIGNHETIYLPDRPFMLRTLGLESISRVVEFHALRAILLDLTVDHQSHGELTPERAEWLAAAVRSNPAKPAIIVQHQLCHATDEICTHRHYIRNSGDYRRLLARLPEVVLIVTGHRHIPTLTKLQNEELRPQITLSALSHYPFTLGELTVDPVSRTATFREVLLESLFNADAAASFANVVEMGHERAARIFPDVWRGRERLTPELSDVEIRLDS